MRCRGVYFTQRQLLTHYKKYYFYLTANSFGQKRRIAFDEVMLFINDRGLSRILLLWTITPESLV